MKKEEITRKVVEAVTAVRLWLPTAPQRFRLFIVSAKEDPWAMLRSPAIRVMALASAGFVVLLFVSCLGDWLWPSREMGTPSETATFRVSCTNPQCRFAGKLQFEPHFRKWPTQCPKCKQKTLYPYVLCKNTKCRKWVTPTVQPDGKMRCPACGAGL